MGEKLYVFGTGNAITTHCYNTCFAIDSGDEYFMVDAGGGNGILKILEDMCISCSHIHNIFVSHEHSDHVQGLGTFAKKFNLPVFVNEKTLDAMPKQKEKISETIITPVSDSNMIKLKIPTSNSIHATTDNTITCSLFPLKKKPDAELTTLLKYSSFNGKSLNCIGE